MRVAVSSLIPSFAELNRCTLPLGSHYVYLRMKQNIIFSFTFIVFPDGY